MSKEKVLIVDDEEDVLELVRYNLAKNGYRIETATTGEEALTQARAKAPDLMILDLMLPGIDGLEVCQKLREDPKTEAIPIIMLTAKGEEADIVTGLELGADDYITKPFSVRELMARIKAVLRRTESTDEEDPPSNLLRGLGQLQMDLDARTVSVEGNTLNLTRLEFDLLFHLLSNVGRVMTRERLLEQAWGYDFAGDTRAVDSAVKRLRAKLRAASASADSIEAVRGIGYRFNK